MAAPLVTQEELSRVQGRGVMYVLLGLMVLARADITVVDWVCGLALVAVGIFSFLVSFWAKRKIQKIHTALVMGHESDPQAMQEAFNRFDKNGNGRLSRAEVIQAVRRDATVRSPPSSLPPP